MTPGDELAPLIIDAVSPEAMKTMAAILRDPNPIHLEPDAARARGLGDRVINQGPTNLGYLQTMLAANAGGAERVRATAVRFLAPVRAGDTVVAGGQVTAVGRSVEGVEVECVVWLEVTNGPRAASGTATLVIPLVDPRVDHHVRFAHQRTQAMECD